MNIYDMLVYDYSDTDIVMSVEIKTHDVSSLEKIELILSLEGVSISNKTVVVSQNERVFRVKFSGLESGQFYKVDSYCKLRDGRMADKKQLLVFTSNNGNVGVNEYGVSLEYAGEPHRERNKQKEQGPHGNEFKDAPGVCKSEKLFGEKFDNDPYLVKLVGGKKVLQKALMDGRKARNLNEYLNQNYKFARPKEHQNERLKRALVYGNAMIQLNKKGISNGDIHEGREYFENNWGMGPFYSYDNNYDEMLRERIRLDSLMSNNDSRMNR